MCKFLQVVLWGDPAESLQSQEFVLLDQTFIFSGVFLCALCISSGFCALGACFPSYCWLYLSLLFTPVARSFLVVFCSDCFPFLLIDPLALSTVLAYLMWVYHSYLLLPVQLQLLTSLLPISTFIRYSQSLFGAFLYKFTLIIKIPPLLIFLYTPCLFNHPSQKNSWRKTERNRVSCLLSLTECFAQQSRYKGQNTFLLSYCNRLPYITKGIAHFILFLLGLNPYPFPFLCCLEVSSQLTISCSNGSNGM